MNILQTIIGSMTKEEQRNYKLFANRTEKKGPRKDILFFDHIKKKYPEYEEEEIQKSLYGKDDKNSLYRLKNRVLEDISKSITLLHFDEVEYNSALYNMALSHLYIRKRLINVAFYYLGKAEKIAKQNEFYEMLDLVYTEFIRLSQEALEINPESYVKLKKENRNRMAKVQQIDDILAVLMYRIRTSQLFSGKKDKKVLNLLQKTVDEFSNDKELKRSPALRFRIYNALSRILLQREDFISLEEYLVKTYHEFTKEKLFTRNNHETKLQMLTYITNAYFKNGKIKQSLQYAEMLKDAMQEFDKILFEKYLFFYYNSLVFNYASVNLDKTIEVLDEAIKNPIIQKSPLQVAFIYLNFSVAYFEKGEFKVALKNIIRLMMEESFNKLDEAFKLKISIAELICRYETQDHEYLEHKAKQILNDNKAPAKWKMFTVDLEMTQLLYHIVRSGKRVRKKINVKNEAEFFVKKYESQKGNDLINYVQWIKGKMKGLKSFS